MNRFSKRAFSLAELMVLLLIISIALVAFAPIMTKSLVGKKSSNPNKVIPTGTITPFYGNNPPEGWLLCDGSDFDTTKYHNLGALLNSNKTPNLKGYFLVGADSTRAVHTYQDSANKEHYHGFYTSTAAHGKEQDDYPFGLAFNDGNYYNIGIAGDANSWHTGGWGTYYYNDGYNNILMKNMMYGDNTVVNDSSDSSQPNDAYPVNVSLNYIIKT